MVICGDIEKSNVHADAVTNTVVIVEVLSKTTASYDRGDKFYYYLQIPSLQAYILIEQDKASVEIYKRETDLWKITRIEGLDSIIRSWDPSERDLSGCGISNLDSPFTKKIIPNH